MAELQVKLLDFWAAWCGPCKFMNPIIEELEEKYKGKIVVDKINVDDVESQSLVMEYHIGAMPTYIIEKNGQVLEQFVGAQSKSTLVAAIERALGNED